MNDDLRKSIEDIKLRAPIEDVVREHVPGLRRRGRLWEACCPFHEERTPSFKVDPQRGTWHCFGACGTGGDAISFVERSQNVEFMEALRILAARTGVSLPDRKSREDDRQASDRQGLFDALARAAEFYKRAFHGPEGVRAREYMAERGLTRETLEAFNVGYAPRGGEVLVLRARASGVSEESLRSAGLARVDEGGRLYDFFRDRLMIPIRDLKGRTVGFGGRRLFDDGPSGPKYINTAETELFHKGRLVFGLDLALEHARRASHLILVEGYTDVMAAHQVGLRTVVAVLGTATTDDHAALVRRTGARRVSLVFDGDEAGRKATFKALTGLLGLDVKLDVVRLPNDDDPCDLLVRAGSPPFEQALESATPWFEFAVRGLESLPATGRAQETDTVLELVGRLPRALDRDAHLNVLAQRLGFAPASVHEQFATLDLRRRAEPRVQPRTAESTPASPSAEERRLERAFGELAGAALLDPSLLAELETWIEPCASPDLADLLRAIVAEGDPSATQVDVGAVFARLGSSPARSLVMPLLEHAERAERPRQLFHGAAEFLRRTLEERALRSELALAGESSDPETMTRLHERLRRIKVTHPTSTRQ